VGGQIQNILIFHGHENTVWFLSTVLCVFTVKLSAFYVNALGATCPVKNLVTRQAI